MRTFKVTFSNADTITTGFNGSLEEAQDYYLSNWFNLGIEDDLMVRGIAVEVVQ